MKFSTRYGCKLLWGAPPSTDVVIRPIGALLLCVAAPFLGRLVGSEISSGGRAQPLHGRGFAWVALLFLLLAHTTPAAEAPAAPTHYKASDMIVILGAVPQEITVFTAAMGDPPKKMLNTAIVMTGWRMAHVAPSTVCL